MDARQRAELQTYLTMYKVAHTYNGFHQITTGAHKTVYVAKFTTEMMRNPPSQEELKIIGHLLAKQEKESQPLLMTELRRYKEMGSDEQGFEVTFLRPNNPLPTTLKISTVNPTEYGNTIIQTVEAVSSELDKTVTSAANAPILKPKDLKQREATIREEARKSAAAYDSAMQKKGQVKPQTEAERKQQALKENDEKLKADKQAQAVKEIALKLQAAKELLGFKDRDPVNQAILEYNPEDFLNKLRAQNQVKEAFFKGMNYEAEENLIKRSQDLSALEEKIERIETEVEKSLEDLASKKQQAKAASDTIILIKAAEIKQSPQKEEEFKRDAYVKLTAVASDIQQTHTFLQSKLAERDQFIKEYAEKIDAEKAIIGTIHKLRIAAHNEFKNLPEKKEQITLIQQQAQEIHDKLQLEATQGTSQIQESVKTTVAKIAEISSALEKTMHSAKSTLENPNISLSDAQKARKVIQTAMPDALSKTHTQLAIAQCEMQRLKAQEIRSQLDKTRQDILGKQKEAQRILSQINELNSKLDDKNKIVIPYHLTLNETLAKIDQLDQTLEATVDELLKELKGSEIVNDALTKVQQNNQSLQAASQTLSTAQGTAAETLQTLNKLQQQAEEKVKVRITALQQELYTSIQQALVGDSQIKYWSKQVHTGGEKVYSAEKKGHFNVPTGIQQMMNIINPTTKRRSSFSFFNKKEATQPLPISTADPLTPDKIQSNLVDLQEISETRSKEKSNFFGKRRDATADFYKAISGLTEETLQNPSTLQTILNSIKSSAAYKASQAAPATATPPANTMRGKKSP